jgi:enoyl-CoA hydratase/carnithine racemase
MVAGTTVVVERQGPVARVTLNRPESRNALDRATRVALAAALADLDADRAVRVLILTGAGSAFCAGVDLKEASVTDGPEHPAATDLEPVAAPLDRLRKPLIAAVNGPAMGGGLELALAADVRIASTRARFGLPEAKIGSFPGSGGVQRLVRAVAASAAASMALTAEPIDADVAYRIGLVSELLEPDALAHRSDELARKIARNAPLSLIAVKQSLRAAAEGPLSAGLTLDRALWAQLATTADRAEGRAAFRERRAPDFTGS